jgi:hypothetical protein
MICFAEPELIDDFYMVHKEEFSVTCYMGYTYTWQKAKPIHKKRTNPLVREDVT